MDPRDALKPRNEKFSHILGTIERERSSRSLRYERCHLCGILRTKHMRKITRRQLEKFLGKYASEKRALDIGSGGSSYARFFPNRLTIDIDPARKPEIVADAHALPFKDGEFEVVLCTEVLEHLIDPRKAVGEMRRVLQKGGLLILTTRFVYPLHDVPHDYWRYTKYGLHELFKEFEIVELRPEVETFSTIGVLLQRIGFQTNLRANAASKIIVYALASLFTHLDWLIRTEYGDIGKKERESGILASGYYLAARKR